MEKRNTVTCGAPSSDFPGFHNTAIQEAVDHVAKIGGGDYNQIEDNVKTGGTAQIFAPSSIIGLELYENMIGGTGCFLCGDRLFDSHIWDNRCEGEIRCENDRERVSYEKTAPVNVRRIDVDRIPENEYRHL